MLTLHMILAQIQHPIWYYNAFFYLFVVLAIVFAIVVLSFVKTVRLKTAEVKTLQQQYLARVDNIRKEHAETLERLRLEMLKREEERTRQWIESEKETLYVLKGVSNLLDLKEKLDHSDSIKILNKFDEFLASINKTE
mgnify:CR=1 FL=1